jgi:hypothetical protein
MFKDRSDGQEDELIMGRLVINGKPKICKNCDGSKGWKKQFGFIKHIGCGFTEPAK